MDSGQAVLTQFHPLITQWFQKRVGRPTDVQQRAWPKIAAGEHLLVTAPTGSGKTLTAFLWALNQLITGQWPTGQTDSYSNGRDRSSIKNSPPETDFLNSLFPDSAARYGFSALLRLSKKRRHRDR